MSTELIININSLDWHAINRIFIRRNRKDLFLSNLARPRYVM
jgi:hypothetical protein